MKKIIYAFIFIFFFININQAYVDNTSYNNKDDIKKIELIEKYIINHNKKINLFIKKYEIKNNNILNKDLGELNTLLKIVEKLKSTTIEKEKSNSILKEVLIKIKNINNSLKIIFTNQKKLFNKNFNKSKKYYGILGINLSKQLDIINIKIAKKNFNNKIKLNTKETKIKQYLILLNIESNKLKNFGKIKFNSETEMKKSFSRILNNIKRNIKNIKNNI